MATVHIVKQFKDITEDKATLGRSWRCAKTVCEFISAKLQISIGTDADRVAGSLPFITKDGPTCCMLTQLS